MTAREGKTMSRRATRPPVLLAERLEVRVLFAGVPIATGVPELSSLPGAPATLLLDFNMSAQFEAAYEAPRFVFDVDRDPTTFSPYEIEVIKEVWSHVADAFSPFNLNVTTVNPAPGDNVARKTMNLLIGGEPQAGGSLGQAVIGGFRDPGYHFATVWDPNLFSIPFTAAHEAGHGFGLLHQSVWDENGQLITPYRTEHGPVGPFMGTHSFRRSLWSDGPTSNGPDDFSDDLATIASPENGFGYRADDHGNSPAAATPIPVANGSGSIAGVMHHHTELDWFTFNWAGGPLAITSEGSPHGPMFLPTVELSNAAGTVLQSATGEQTWKMIRADLPVGTYRLRVTSAAYTDRYGTRNYGNVGQYTLRLTPGTFAQAQMPYLLRPFAVSGSGVSTIEMEHYDRGGEGVSYHNPRYGYWSNPHRGDEGMHVSTDLEELFVLAEVRTGDWAEYTIEVERAGAYDLWGRLTGYDSGGRVHFELDGSPITPSLDVPFATSRKWLTSSLGRVNLPAGRHVLRFAADGEGDMGGGVVGTGKFNWIRLAPAPPAGTQAPLFVDPFPVTRAGPTMIEAEDFDRGGEGVAYHDLTPGQNTGSGYRPAEGVDLKLTTDGGDGFRLSDASAGEWLEYTIDVATAGAYRLEFRAGVNGTGGAFHAEVDGVNVTGRLTVPNTGGYDTMRTIVSPTVQLTAGVHVLRLAMDANTATGAVAGFNWLKVAPVTQTTTTTLRAARDAYVRGGSTYGGTNFGTSTDLVVRKAATAGSTRETYLHFSLADFGAADLETVKLRLFGRSSSSTQAIGVALHGGGTASWTEGGITWNNKPASEATVLGTRTVSGTGGAWHEFDVTSYVKARKAAGATAVTFVLKGTATTDAQATFGSDEHATSGNRPQLVVTSKPATPQQGLVVSATSLSVAEGGSAAFTVKLATQPAADVTVTVAKAPGGDGDLTTATTTLTFTPANWNVARSVSVAAAEDADAASGAASFTISSPGLAGMTVVASESDNDAPVAPVTLRAAADAYVRDGTSSSTNFGTATELVTKRATVAGSTRESYLRFDLSGGPATISSAKLRLFGRLGDTSSASLATQVFGASNTTWGETGITWDNRPATGAGALGTITVSGTTAAWYELDLTAFLKAEKAAGRTLVTLVLRNPTASSAQTIFASDEATTGRPELVVTA
jgi:hypothetical protein